MLRTYEGYWDGGHVLLIDSSVKIANGSRVLITVLEETGVENSDMVTDSRPLKKKKSH